MSKRFLATWLAVLLMVPAVRAADPSVVVRVQSVDDLLKTASYFAKLADKEEEAKQFLGVVEAMKGPMGLEGIDTTRPIGFFGEVTPGGFDSVGILAIPVADQDTFLNFLARFGIEPEKGEDGTYSVERAEVPVPIYFRFAQKYAVATVMTKENIDPKNLPNISEALKGNGSNLISIAAHLDRLPKEVRDLALGQLEMGLAQARDNEQAPTEAQEKFRLAALDSMVGAAKMVLEQGGEVQFGLGVDHKKDEIQVTFDFGAKSGSELAGRISALGKKSSVVLGSLREKGNAVAMGANVELPDSVKKALGAVVDEGFKQLAEKAAVDAPIDVRLVENLLKAVEPTAKSGAFDLGVAMHGPNEDGKFVILAAAKVSEGEKIVEALQKLVGDLPGEFQQVVKFNDSKSGDATLHRVILPPEAGLDENARQIFGEKIDIWLATSDDRFLVAMGPSSGEVLKAALSAKKTSAPIASVQVSMKAIASLMEEENPGSVKAAEEVFAGAPEGADRVTISVTGGEKLQVRIAVKTAVVAFFAKMEELSNSLE